MSDTMTDMTGTVLVVDDDTFTAELTSIGIEMAGFETVIAEGGMDALEKIEANPGFLAVVSDMNMPMMDGVELFTELRRNGYSRPFLLITGEDAGPLKEAHPDIDAVLTKDENLQDNLPEILASLLTSK